VPFMTTRCHVIGHGLGTGLYCWQVQKLSLVSVALAFALLSGCSSEPSPQEKRNLYDKCILDYQADRMTASIPAMNAVIAQAPYACRHLLG
jgi:outer membrane murein-binding lipoprotein Lpp